jgi:hypothetical protein
MAVFKALISQQQSVYGGLDLVIEHSIVIYSYILAIYTIGIGISPGISDDACIFWYFIFSRFLERKTTF